ncbi:MAG: hemerythrin family protein [Deltaproteobacteria bacterium]|nr:hemerythrin family protein [Deltaproteobacteria bacterium]
MGLIWTASLATGVDWQDSQHKDLFCKINEFIEAINRGKTQGDLLGLFNFLSNYVRTHFKQEEVAMDKHGYPGTVAHKALHKTFMDNLSVLQKGLREQEDIHKLTMQARKLLSDWFYDHVAKMDKNLGGFLVTKR